MCKIFKFIRSCKIVKFLVLRINSITSHEFAVKYVFRFSKEIFEQDIDICTNTICNQQDVIEGINKEEFRNLLSLATKESYFLFQPDFI